MFRGILGLCSCVLKEHSCVFSNLGSCYIVQTTFTSKNRSYQPPSHNFKELQKCQHTCGKKATKPPSLTVTSKLNQILTLTRSIQLILKELYTVFIWFYMLMNCCRYLTQIYAVVFLKRLFRESQNKDFIVLKRDNIHIKRIRLTLPTS